MDTISHILSSISGIASFPTLALLLFLTLFVAIVIWVIKLDKQFIVLMSNIPLDSNSPDSKDCEDENE